MDFLVIGKNFIFPRSLNGKRGMTAKRPFLQEKTNIRANNTNWFLEALQGTR